MIGRGLRPVRFVLAGGVERFFHLDDEDRRLVARRRDYNRSGFAVQMVTVRHLGMLLPDPLDVPLELVEYLAEQLGINATFVSTPKSATNRSSAAAYVSRVFAMLIVPRYTWTASARCTPPAGPEASEPAPSWASACALPHIVSRVACVRRGSPRRDEPGAAMCGKSLALLFAELFLHCQIALARPTRRARAWVPSASAPTVTPAVNGIRSGFNRHPP